LGFGPCPGPACPQSVPHTHVRRHSNPDPCFPDPHSPRLISTQDQIERWWWRRRPPLDDDDALMAALDRGRSSQTSPHSQLWTCHRHVQLCIRSDHLVPPKIKRKDSEPLQRFCNWTCQRGWTWTRHGCCSSFLALFCLRKKTSARGICDLRGYQAPLAEHRATLHTPWNPSFLSLNVVPPWMPWSRGSRHRCSCLTWIRDACGFENMTGLGCGWRLGTDDWSHGQGQAPRDPEQKYLRKTFI